MNGLFKQVSLWVVLAIIVVLVLTRFSEIRSRSEVTGQADFLAQLEADNIEDPVSVLLGENSVEVYVRFREPVGEMGQKDLRFTVPEFKPAWEELLETRGLNVEFSVENSLLPNMIFQLILLLVIVGVFWFFMIRQMQRTYKIGGGSRTLVGKRGEKATVWDDVPSGAMAEAIEEAIDANGRAILAGVLFDSGQATIRPESKSALEGVAAYLKTCPYRTFYVVGHTEAAGASAFPLSLDRAQAVVDALVRDYGIAADRLEAHGVGALVPVRNNATDDGREKNRRVELVER